MARDQNTFAKRQREMEKKRKAEDKRARRRKKKEEDTSTPIDPALIESEDSDEAEEADVSVEPVAERPAE